ncbi:MAG: response regulator [Rhodocyclaceae bacterium]|nr:response regulator [Rhodocyclaceae bacterium]
MKPLRRILYVEDDADIRMVACLALESIGGFEVSACASGEEALDVADDFAPDMILLDVMMPGMDGPSTLRALRGLPGFADTPVAFMTAKVQPEELAEYGALGSCDAIAKPFDPMLLADQVRALWESVNGC